MFERFGTKAEFVTELAAYYRGISAYEDVLRTCEEYAPRTPDSAIDETAPTEVTFGSVYLMKSGRFYKIGRSNSVGRREYE